MKKKLIVSILFLLASTNFIYSQIKLSLKKFQTPLEEISILKPAVYDSTKTLEEQFKLQNKYQFIGLQLFLPPILHPENGPIIFSERSNGLEKGNKKYIITGILEGDIEKQLSQKNAINQCGSRYKEFDSFQWKDLIIYVVFVLRDNDQNDHRNNAPLYWIVAESKTPPYSFSYFNSFISFPYFEKQKQLYQGQTVIDLNDKSKWFCKEVTLLKSKDVGAHDSIYDIFCVLKNEKGEQVQLKPPSEKRGNTFITEKEYIRLDHANKNQKYEMQQAENDRKEKNKTECIKKFGQHYGELVSQTKITIGMTAEMCKTAWGEPWDTNRKGDTKEIWFYNWKYNLYFENGKLVEVEH